MKPKKKQNDLLMKVLYGTGFFLIEVFFFLLAKILPFCRQICRTKLSIFELLWLPMMAFAAVLASEAIYKKVKKIEEKRVEMDDSGKVPPEILIRVLMTSFMVSLVVAWIPNMIYLAIYHGRCRGLDYEASCGSGMVVMYNAIIFPIISAGAVFVGHLLAYRLFVPLSHVGYFPNGKEIMKRKTPIWVHCATIAMGILAAILIMIVTPILS